MKPTPAKPKIIIAQVEGSGTVETEAAARPSGHAAAVPPITLMKSRRRKQLSTKVLF
jgi:hypothetical protein